MTIRTHYFAAAAAIAALAVPAAAQTAYPYGYQQQYQQVPQPYPGQPGNRYTVTDRQAVSQCASAAMTQAQAQYGNRYNQGYGNNRGYNNAMRVTSITDVQRRNNGLRVSGLMSSGYASQYGNQNRGYAQGYSAGNVSFRCNVDYRGQVTNVKIGRNNAYRG
jgi:hypothetical protein